MERSAKGRLHKKSQANLAQSYRAELEADGIARLLGFRLAEARFVDRKSFPLPMDGSSVVCMPEKGPLITVALQDQAGLIDLNQTSPIIIREPIGRS